MGFAELKRKAAKEAENQAGQTVISIGTATCGRASGALDTLKEIKKEIKKRDLKAKIFETGCLGLCYSEPLVNITRPGGPELWFHNVTKDKVRVIIEEYLLKDDPGTKKIPVMKPPDFRFQERNILRNCGRIDPENLLHYVAQGGYDGFTRALEIGKGRVIEELKKSGLRGRGGAGFPTWKKWQLCLERPEDEKYIICNADEGDPGAFMNRALLESDPHSVLEGMLIAGYTLGAKTGYIYCRAEYPLAVQRIQKAISQLPDILDNRFNMELIIKEGAGAFVCGEETALIASIEGRRGMPRHKPPFPAEAGLFGKPTVINNVETYANVSLIMKNGPDWFNGFGIEKNRGTKTFCLVGKIKYPGLIEVPLGTKLSDVIFEAGGGIQDNKIFKAVQTGGPSGGCLPAALLGNRVDYESLASAGTIMGSGGMVVMDEDTCMVDIARFFLEFTQKESCGQCAPCRIGTKQLLEILNDITKGRGRPGDIELLSALGETIKKTSLCGLGQTAPNPVLSTIRHFRQEYEEHIAQKYCRAGVCREFIKYIIKTNCTGCGVCRLKCPAAAISGEKKGQHVIDYHKCTKCGICFESCRFKAIEKK